MAAIKKVKIFVSHRIDLNSVVVENEVYQPVRCGACFDPDYSGGIPGDNTGDNISEFRSRLGEFTVQYWAWKNAEADYYGLCHYRRYLSFAEKKYPTDEKQQVVEGFLDETTIEKYGLNNPAYIEKLVSDYDAVVGEYAEINGMFTPRGPQETIYEHFCAYDGYLVNKEDVDLFLDTVDTLYPKMGKYTREYFAGKKFRGFNCFILKKELFIQLCDIEISVMEAIRETGKINFDYRTDIQSRTYGFFTEWIYGSFLYYLEKNTDVKIKEMQLVYFENTEKPVYPQPVTEHIPVAYLVNRYLLPVALVSVQSLLKNKKNDTKYDIIMLHNDLVLDEQQRIEAYYGDTKGISIRFLNIRNNLPSASNGVRWNCTNNTPSAASLLPWLLPKYKRVIFLHADVLVKTDLRELYEMDFATCWVIAPLDYIRISENNSNRDILKLRKYKLGMENPYHFFSTSVMALNLTTLREEVSFDQMIRYARESYFLRDIMNRICAGKVIFLDAEWNVCPSASNAERELRGFMPKVYSDECTKAQKTPKVIHYQSYPKHWQTPFREAASDFWMLARVTPLYEQLLMCASSASYPQPVNAMHAAADKLWPRKVADRIAPIGSKRRDFLKEIIPKGSFGWNLLRRIYYFFRR